MADPSLPSEPERQFRFDKQRVLLTYSTHLEKDAYIKWLLERLNMSAVNFIRLAHESGDEECNYLHTHVVVDLGKRFQTKNARFFDYMNIHPHIKTLPNAKALEDAKLYIAKEDVENADLKVEKVSLYKAVSMCNNVQEALDKFVNKPSDANGIKTLFEAKPKDPQLKRFNYTPEKEWQLSLLKTIEGTPDNRSITWIFDRKGNSGKTALAKWLYVNSPKDWFITKDMGTSRDSSTVIQNALENGWEAHGIIIDLPRAAEEHKRIYQYIEEIKDGFVTSQKYSGKTMAFDNPHVVVFANWPPQRNCLSLDRWKIFYIKDEKLVKWNDKDYGNPDPRK